MIVKLQTSQRFVSSSSPEPGGDLAHLAHLLAPGVLWLVFTSSLLLHVQGSKIHYGKIDGETKIFMAIPGWLSNFAL